VLRFNVKGVLKCEGK